MPIPSKTAQRPKTARSTESSILFGLILFQGFCGVFLFIDAVGDIKALGWQGLTDWHLLPELGATLGLLSGVVALSVYLMRVLRRQALIQQGLSVAQGALAEVMEAYFQSWGLTPSEQDVAAFTIKGYSIAEIAGLRGSAEATVKTHLNAIYRKAGVAGRAQLASLLIEDLMRGPLVEAKAEQAARERPSATVASDT
jgi:DNA-binding CsgD family transcriptional regulator